MELMHPFYQGNPLLLLPVLSLLLFATVFLVASVRAWRKVGPGKAPELTSLPLLDDTAPRRSSGEGHD